VQSLSALTSKVGSGATPRGGAAAYAKSGIPLIRSQNVRFEGFAHQGLAFLSDRQAQQLDNVKVESGDVLLNITGASIGRVSIAPQDMSGARVNQHVCIIRPRDTVLSYFLAAYLSAPQIQDAIAIGNYGVTREALTKSQVLEIPVPVPDLPEQEAIVSRLGSIGTKRLSALAHTAVARRAIERFRQAILAAACSGRLTADWRDANPDVRSVDQALAKLPSRKRGASLHDDLSDLLLPDLPDSYIVSTVGRASTVLEYGTSRRADAASSTGVPILRMGNIQDGQLELEDLKYISLDREIERLMLEDGDLLFNRTNSPELVGKSAVFHEQTPMTFASYLIRVRFAPEVAEPDFVHFWINSAWGKAWARQVKNDGVSQSNINGTKLGAMPLPLPPIEEQREVVHRASRMLELADGLLARIEVAARRVDFSSQAVLAKAFRGGLPVPAYEGSQP